MHGGGRRDRKAGGRLGEVTGGVGGVEEEESEGEEVEGCVIEWANSRRTSGTSGVYFL